MYGNLRSFIKFQLMPCKTEGNISERIPLGDNYTSTEDDPAVSRSTLKLKLELNLVAMIL